MGEDFKEVTRYFSLFLIFGLSQPEPTKKTGVTKFLSGCCQCIQVGAFNRRASSGGGARPTGDCHPELGLSRWDVSRRNTPGTARRGTMHLALHGSLGDKTLMARGFPSDIRPGPLEECSLTLHPSSLSVNHSCHIPPEILGPESAVIVAEIRRQLALGSSRHQGCRPGPAEIRPCVAHRGTTTLGTKTFPKHAFVLKDASLGYSIRADIIMISRSAVLLGVFAAWRLWVEDLMLPSLSLRIDRERET
ncbi:hypothetical protein RRG08_003556 [Elysia crispata]|uniref:Uncharacterized protein n=1 Tax=Elysia crispata TaxID=231223 RepID=A0AAE1CTN5_9GAST|nr:hypothetical protein RRG08_003556 [Elysia crispata]